MYVDPAGNAFDGAINNQSEIYLLDGHDDLDVTSVIFTDVFAYGGSGDDILRNSGNAVAHFYGDFGIDLLIGGALGDFLFGGDHFDQLFGQGGADELYGGNGSDQLDGGANNDKLYGGSGNDTLFSGSGNDRLSGDDGHDSYRISEVGDRVLEHFGEGTDTVEITGIDYTLPANVENLTMFFGFAVDGTGNALANTMSGNNSINVLKGLSGNDVLDGIGGDDRLVGGTGKDTMTGGPGRDDFDFDLTGESVVGTNRDVIMDFQRGLDDIDLSTIDANTTLGGNQAFAFRASLAFSKVAGQLRFIDQGNTCLVQGDVNGDGKADFEISVNVATLGAGDFVL
ncbi:MAG TPA: calcium-binding protein [Rhizobiaceae bacterium]|nr:calcium-binding protein [Rhizobiaceae bacterium]